MTEADWLRCAVPMLMLDLVQSKPVDRKLRLFAVACCRRIWHLIPGMRGQEAVSIAEGYADGCETPDRLRSARRGPGYRTTDHALFAADDTLCASAKKAAWYASGNAIRALTIANPDTSHRDEQRHQAALLRCIFGNPFRPVTPDPSWFTPTVAQLASGIYADRAFDRLPILADALQDAGCEDAAVLDRCRGPGPHARGCFVLDTLLGKE